MVSRLVGLIAMGIVVACAQGTMAQCTTVDAVTTASFKITGGQACSTSATLNWTFNQNNGTMTIKWGTSTSYGASKSVYASNPISLTGLTPQTKYFYAVDGFYENQNHPYTRSSFTTSGGSAANHAPVFTSAATVTCTTGTTKTYTATATDADNNPVTFTAGTLPSWITFASPTLTLKPVMGCTNTTVTIIASDGKGGLDTLSLAVTLATKTGIVVKAGHEMGVGMFFIGNTHFSVPISDAQPVTLELFTLNGSVAVGRQMISAKPGNTQTVVFRNAGPGVYLVKVSAPSGSSRLKVFIGK